MSEDSFQNPSYVIRIVSPGRNPTYIIIGITQFQALRDRLTPERPSKDKIDKIITFVLHFTAFIHYVLWEYMISIMHQD
jgi:hypothetical protein